MISKGFFNKTECGTGYKIKRLTGCGSCGLTNECQTPKIKSAGQGQKGILIISEIPCNEEDKSGRLMRGEASRWLKKKFAIHGIDMEKDCKKIAAVSCRTPKGRSPTNNEIAMCRPTVWKEINEYKPETIILLGNASINSFLGERWQKGTGSINKWRGWVIPDRKTKAWVAPMLHPSYVIKSTTTGSKTFNRAVEVIFNQDLERAFLISSKDFPVFGQEKDMVQIIKDPEKLMFEFSKIIKNKRPIAFDFETTGLKPQAKGHRIVSCAISASRHHSIAFPMPHKGPVAKRLRQLLEDPSIPKWAHNIKFENNWAKIRYRTEIQGWEWDSMVAAHILDNRSGITGLKFQVYVYLGVIDYSSHLDQYLKSEEGANAINRIDEAPLDELLMYNGLDSLFQYRLATIQMAYLKNGMYP